jgi:hypothetical protein
MYVLRLTKISMQIRTSIRMAWSRPEVPASGGQIRFGPWNAHVSSPSALGQQIQICMPQSCASESPLRLP